MKKIYNILYLAIAILAVACSNEEEDLFSESSSHRADAAIQEYTKVLTDAPDGWLMECFPEAQQSYGGYNILLRFGTDGKVQAASELYAANDVMESYYSVKQSAGIVLSFDTYNEIFHFFSDPSDPSGVGGNGYGLEGDYDYLIIEATAEKVVLKGKKTGCIAVMTPMQSNDWSGYLSRLQEADSQMTFPKLQLELGDEVIPVSTSFRTLTFTFEEGETSRSVTASYIQTETGYKFYEPIDIKGTTLSEFVYDEAGEVFTVSDNPSVRLVPVIPPLSEQFAGGDWYFAYSALCSAYQPYFDMAAQGSAGEGEEILYMYMGTSSSGAYGFNFRSGNYAGCLNYNCEILSDNEVMLSFAIQGDNNGVYYYNNCNYGAPISAIGGSSGVTYQLEADDVKAPTYIKLTRQDNPDLYMTLYANQIAYPFQN